MNQKESISQIVERASSVLMNTYARIPVALVKGQGCRVWDQDGREYQDFLAGIAVTIAWRAGYRFWLVKRYGGNRVDPDEVHRRMREGEDLLVIDLRRDDDFAASDRMIAGAARLRPASFHRHAMHLPRDRDLVFYCT